MLCLYADDNACIRQYLVKQKKELLECLRSEWGAISFEGFSSHKKCVAFGDKALRIIASDTGHLEDTERARVFTSEWVIDNERTWINTMNKVDNKSYARNAFCSDLEVRDKQAVSLVKDLFAEIAITKQQTSDAYHVSASVSVKDLTKELSDCKKLLAEGCVWRVG
jgi:hypothetical protein